MDYEVSFEVDIAGVLMFALVLWKFACIEERCFGGTQPLSGIVTGKR